MDDLYTCTLNQLYLVYHSRWDLRDNSLNRHFVFKHTPYAQVWQDTVSLPLLSNLCLLNYPLSYYTSVAIMTIRITCTFSLNTTYAFSWVYHTLMYISIQ